MHPKEHDNKRTYRTKADAKRALKSAMQSPTGPRTLYRCEFCSQWHLSKYRVKKRENPPKVEMEGVESGLGG